MPVYMNPLAAGSPEANLAVQVGGADLRGAQLSEAVLIKANLSVVNLSGADLSRADLTEADLRGADLREALNLTQVQVDSAKGNRETRLPTGLRIPERWLR